MDTLLCLFVTVCYAIGACGIAYGNSVWSYCFGFLHTFLGDLKNEKLLVKMWLFIRNSFVQNATNTINV